MSGPVIEGTEARWEWRTFDRTLPVGASLVETARTGVPQAAEETYVLSSDPRYCVTIRDGQIGIEHLEEVSPDGLQRWRPVLKQPFPVDRSTMLEICRALATCPANHGITHYSVNDFLLDIVAHDPALEAVRVSKLRSRLALPQCGGEFVALRAGGQRHESLAFEHTDPEHVLAAVSSLGFDPRTNTSYIAGLTRILGRPEASSYPSAGVTRYAAC